MTSACDCREFDQQWNERLDERVVGLPEQASILADHAARCESCRARGLIYAEFETALPPWSRTLPPSAQAIERWQAAATSALTTARRPDRRPFRVASKWGIVSAVAALGLVGAQGPLLVLFPYGPELSPTIQNTPDSSRPVLTEAFAEASTITRELAQEVSAPAARIGSEALGWREKTPMASVMLPRDIRGKSSGEGGTTEAAIASSPEQSSRSELTSGTSRHAFRFLTGLTPDDSLEPETFEGY